MAERATGVPIGKGEPASLAKIVQQELLAGYAPFSVLISRKYEVLYVYGDSWPYWALTTGDPNQDLLTMAHQSVRTA